MGYKMEKKMDQRMEWKMMVSEMDKMME